MSTQKKRVQTIIAVLQSSASLSQGNFNKVKAELNEVVDVHNITRTKRRNLMKVLHSTRALDSTLKSMLDFHTLRGAREHSIGQYLTKLEEHNSAAIGNLTPTERSHYQRKIADLRNKHLHTADSYPADEREVNEMLSEMHKLLSRLATL